MTKPLLWRIAAVQAYFSAIAFVSIHTKAELWPLVTCLFLALIPGHDVVDVKGFATRWKDRFLATGTVYDLSREGRHPILPDATAKECVRQLLDGYDITIEKNTYEKVGGKKKLTGRVDKVVHRYYTSIRDAVRRNEYIREVLDTYGISECTFWRRLQHVAPGLRRRHLHPKKGLSQKNKEARVSFCKSLKTMSREKMLHYLSRCFFIDSKTFYICPSSMWVYAPPGVDMTVVDERLPNSRFATKKIVYYAVVNPILGPVYIELVTGTAEHDKDPNYTRYMVRISTSHGELSMRWFSAAMHCHAQLVLLQWQLSQ